MTNTINYRKENEPWNYIHKTSIQKHFLTEHYCINFWSSASSSDATFCTAWYNRLRCCSQIKSCTLSSLKIYIICVTPQRCTNGISSALTRKLSMPETVTDIRWRYVWYDADGNTTTTSIEGGRAVNIGLRWLTSNICRISSAAFDERHTVATSTVAFRAYAS